MIGKFVTAATAGVALVIAATANWSLQTAAGAAAHQLLPPAQWATPPVLVNRANKGDRLPLFRPTVPADHFAITVMASFSKQTTS